MNKPCNITIHPGCVSIGLWPLLIDSLISQSTNLIHEITRNINSRKWIYTDLPHEPKGLGQSCRSTMQSPELNQENIVS
jgi:hypothetical protein